MNHSWVPFYREITKVVLGKEDQQGELIALLREMKDEGLPVIPLEDNQPDKSQKPLEVIDPFTFLANFSRTGDEQAIKLCAWIKKKWGISAPVPSDFEGRALVQARGGGSWFFGSVETGRQPEDVGHLWTLARQAYDADLQAINFDLFKTCLKQNNLGIRKLTNGLSWLSPKGFLPLGGQMLPYLKSQGIDFDARAIEQRDVDEYRELVKKAHELSYDNLEITNNAQNWDGAVVGPVKPPIKTQLPLNQILYGPPGTGKTYNAIPRAVEIIDGIVPADRAECQERFDVLRSEGRIGFVTFHQSFTYEEFIEGLRPRLNQEDGKVSYEVRDGVLKQMALEALGVSLINFETLSLPFASIWKIWTDSIERGEHNEIDGISERSHYFLTLEDDTIVGENQLSQSPNRYFRCHRDVAAQLWEIYSAHDRISASDVRAVFPKLVVESTFCAVVINEMKAIDDASISNDSLARDYLTGELEAEFSAEHAPRYVLIVDEINRGNISKILGELITLLEEDKRLGRANELRVTLPVSLETFALPPNLYILGTMNTADKSLALLDIALRRRFEFEEIRPNFDLAALKLSKDMRDCLKTLNLRLEAALDREHCLGHAYFVGVESRDEFNHVFRAKIIPLLQEFFYNDWETLRAVLGEAGSKGKTGFIRELKELKGLRNRTRWRWWFDLNAAEEFDCLATLTANFAALVSDSGDDESE